MVELSRKVDVRLPGKGISNSHVARPVHLIITMLKWIRTSSLSIKNSLSAQADSSGAAWWSNSWWSDSAGLEKGSNDKGSKGPEKSSKGCGNGSKGCEKGSKGSEKGCVIVVIDRGQRSRGVRNHRLRAS